MSSEAYSAITGSKSREVEILLEIRNSESKADDIIEKAKLEKESTIKEAAVNASRLMALKEEDAKKLHDKKVMESRDKIRLLREEKLAEGKNVVKLVKAKAEKNIAKAVDFVMSKFEEVM